ncbi:hypothetical protein I7I51_00052 [Histoplasma capsulatum]|uniref:Uncharacterized protein n=1 Tax=Ajellomyces capsulatus TaxID=5037 RepID=A0A8A1M914_AJECA|nr:hypothetical protein I7I51_00052 [Histoplasma capsulatum]
MFLLMTFSNPASSKKELPDDADLNFPKDFSEHFKDEIHKLYRGPSRITQSTVAKPKPPMVVWPKRDRIPLLFLGMSAVWPTMFSRFCIIPWIAGVPTEVFIGVAERFMQPMASIKAAVLAPLS